jgi:large subunit ribosomal protein L7/L12
LRFPCFLFQAKKLVESIPQVLRDNLSKADAEKIKAKIEAVGGVCVID